MIVLCLLTSIKDLNAQYFKTRFDFNAITNELSFYIKPTGFLSSDIGSFQFDVTYPTSATINFGSVSNNTVGFPGLNVIESNHFVLNNEWVKRWEHQGLIPFQTYNPNTEYLVFSVNISGSGTLTLNYKSDYSNFDPVFTVNSDDGTPLWDNSAPYDVYYPIQLQSGSTIYMTLNVTLPVTLSNFSTLVDGKSVFLDWSTSSEHNFWGFEVERSIDGKEFEKIGFEKSIGGTELTNYHFEDLSKKVGSEYFYRLKIMDFDGKFEYSNIEIARIAETEYDFKIIPNPANQFIHLVSEGGVSPITNLSIYDNFGKLMIQNPPIDQNKIDVSFLPSGLYFVKVNDHPLQKVMITAH
jgi:hypothetical protein